MKRWSRCIAVSAVSLLVSVNVNAWVGSHNSRIRIHFSYQGKCKPLWTSTSKIPSTTLFQAVQTTPSQLEEASSVILSNSSFIATTTNFTTHNTRTLTLEDNFKKIKDDENMIDVDKKCSGLATTVLKTTKQQHYDDDGKIQIGTMQQTKMNATIKSKYEKMPWKTSIDPNYSYDELFFMPFWEWQLEFMKSHLSNLKRIPTADRTNDERDLTYVENLKKKKRMITLCFESDEYRLIRLTYLDAGSATQVFTSLFYPRANIPVLGIDFLQFNNQTRHLTVVDMQPIHPSEADHDLSYSHLLEPVRERYPRLQNRMSKRFYDENQFFSSQMLLGRGEDGPDYVWEDLFPAYKEYLQIHLSMTKEVLIPKHSNNRIRTVLEQHKAYDDYSSVRDPAHGLLKSIFGKDYADAFVFDVLFPLSDGVHSLTNSTDTEDK